MNDVIVSLLISAAVPVVSLAVFRANAAVSFFAACTGIVLLSGLDPAVVSTSAVFLPGEGEAYVRIAVMMLTMLLAALLYRHTVHDALRWVLHGTITLCTVAMLWVVLPSKTGVGALLNVIDEPLWITVSNYETLIVAVGFSISVLIVLKNR